MARINWRTDFCGSGIARNENRLLAKFKKKDMASCFHQRREAAFISKREDGGIPLADCGLATVTRILIREGLLVNG